MVIIIPGSIFTISCSPAGQTPGLRIVSDTLLANLPSGSGLVVWKNHLFVVGDDASGFFEWNFSTNPFIFHPYNKGDSLYRIDKEIKYDPESLAVIEADGAQKLIAFGSGSGTRFRNNIYLIDPKTKDSEKFDGTALYALLKQQNNIAEKDFNLEAAFARGNDLYLFNRGDNGIIEMKVNVLLQYLRGETRVLATRYNKVILPEQQVGIPRFSGATAIGKKDILFCASIEQTTDWMKDGAVSGSFIGLVRQKDNGYKLNTLLPLQRNGKLLIEKLESVAVAEKLSRKKYRIYAISDNDNGSSMLFELELY